MTTSRVIHVETETYPLICQYQWSLTELPNVLAALLNDILTLDVLIVQQGQSQIHIQVDFECSPC